MDNEIKFECYNCNGSGKLPAFDTFPEIDCYLCSGTGKLDWLDYIIPPDPDLLVLPGIKEFFPKLIAKELVSVQPMTCVIDPIIYAQKTKVNKKWLNLIAVNVKVKEVIK